MNNDTNATEATVEDNRWWDAYEQDAFAISNNAAFGLFLFLGILTLTICIFTIRRQSKRQTTSSCAQAISYLCILIFFTMLTTGFLLIAAYAQQYRSIQQEHSGAGVVRIIDTRVVSDNTTFYSTSGDYSQGFVAQARVVFGGEWACGTNDTLCDIYVVVTECSKRVCDNLNCTRSERKQAQENATACLSNLVEDYELPIDNTTIDVGVPPQLDPNYPNFPLMGMSLLHDVLLCR